MTPTAEPRPTVERIWCAYLVAVCAVAVLAPGGGAEGHEPGWFVAVHGGVALAVAWSWWIARRRSHDAARLARAAVAMVGLPTVFSALCWLLPAVHPEPYEYTWLALDRWLFGQDLARYGDPLPKLAVELLQLDYGLFYFLCVAAAVAAGLASGRAAFDRAVAIFVLGFTTSYLGYLLVPTLGPNHALAHPGEPVGLWLSDWVRHSIDAGEANPWDCFPSGHTQMTVIALIVAFRWARRVFWAMLLPGLALIASTMLLRYHWASDVAAGALWAWPCVRLCDWLCDRDGWPRARRPAGAPRT